MGDTEKRSAQAGTSVEGLSVGKQGGDGTWEAAKGKVEAGPLCRGPRGGWERTGCGRALGGTEFSWWGGGGGGQGRLPG